MLQPAVIATEIAMFATQIEAALPALAAIPSIKPETLAIITTSLDGLKVAATAFATADAASAPALIDRIETDANAVLGALASLPLPPQVVTPMRIAQMSLPVLLMVAKMYYPG